MTGEKPSGAESRQELNQAVVAVSNLSRVLVGLKLLMRQSAPNSTIENAEFYFPKEVAEARVAGQAAAGLPIYGGVGVHHYYMARQKVYERGMLPAHPLSRKPNHFQGVLRAIGDVPTQGLRGDFNRFSIALDPLYTLNDQELSRYYAERGWQLQLRQPFNEEKNQDERLYLPVDSLDEEGIHLIDLPWTLSAANNPSA